jgi:hypothetical protein
MTYEEQVDALTFELDSIISRYRNEFDLHLPTIIGIFEQKKSDLIEDNRLEFEIEDFELEDEDEDDFLS